MGLPLATVIVANYNYGRFLQQCLESVLAQSYANIELIVVDDGSTDESARVLAPYGNRVRTIFQANGGQAAALSTGFAASTGDYIFLLDADDGWYAHKVQTVLETFAQQPQALWVRHKLALVTEDLKPLHREVPRFRGSRAVLPDPMLLAEGTLVAGTALALRRPLAAKVFPVIVPSGLALHADDAVLFARILAARAEGYSLDAVLGYYRKHSGERFSADDLPLLLKREAAVAEGLGTVFNGGVPSSAYKLHVVVAALEGARCWQPPRLLNYLRGLRVAGRLWKRPMFMLRQALALTFAFAAPGLWLRKLKSQVLPT